MAEFLVAAAGKRDFEFYRRAEIAKEAWRGISGESEPAGQEECDLGLAAQIDKKEAVK